MLKRTIKYKDFDDNDVEEVFYFNLSQSELVELESMYKGGLGSFLQNIVKADNREEIIKQFKRLILMSYGEKSEDGKRFVKSDEMAMAFSQTLAYDSLFMELATHAGKGADFVLGILPKEFADKAKSQMDQDKPIGPPRPPSS
jgi:hypothetical protein